MRDSHDMQAEANRIALAVSAARYPVRDSVAVKREKAHFGQSAQRAQHRSLEQENGHEHDEPLAREVEL
jgi:hypothetical protein